MEEASEFPSCGVKQKPMISLLVLDRERRRRDDGLREDAAVVAVVAAEGEDLVGRAALGQRDRRVGFQAGDHVLPGRRLRQLHVEPERVHVLRVQLHRGGEDRRRPADRLESSARRRARGACRTPRRRACRPTGPGRSPASWEMSFARRMQTKRAACVRVRAPPSSVPSVLMRHGDVVRVARDDLQEAVLAGNERLVVDPASRTSCRTRTRSPGRGTPSGPEIFS